MKRKIIIISVALFLILASLIGMKFLEKMKNEPEKNVSEQAKLQVQAVSVVYSDVKSGIVASGRLESKQMIDLSAEVQGKILAGNLPLKEGQRFQKGDLLAKIYDREAYYGLLAKKSRFLNAIANILPDFKIDFSDSYSTWVNFFDAIDIKKELPDLPNITSKQEKIFLASRNILSDFYSIKGDEIRLNKYRLLAPFTGMYTQVYLEVGSIANPGARLAQLIRTDQMEMQVPIDAINAQWVAVGDPVKVSTEDERETWKAKVIRKAAYIDQKTQSVSVFIGLSANSKKPLLPGMYMKAFFPGKNIRGMKIPRTAVFNHNQVFVVENGKLAKTKVNIIKINNKVLIFNGLEEGVQLISEPLVNAIEGTEVEIL